MYRAAYLVLHTTARAALRFLPVAVYLLVCRRAALRLDGIARTLFACWHFATPPFIAAAVTFTYGAYLQTTRQVYLFSGGSNLLPFTHC
jgi:hypothetical protein